MQDLVKSGNIEIGPDGSITFKLNEDIAHGNKNTENKKSFVQRIRDRLKGKNKTKLPSQPIYEQSKEELKKDTSKPIPEYKNPEEQIGSGPNSSSNNKNNKKKKKKSKNTNQNVQTESSTTNTQQNSTKNNPYYSEQNLNFENSRANRRKLEDTLRNGNPFEENKVSKPTEKNENHSNSNYRADSLTYKDYKNFIENKFTDEKEIGNAFNSFMNNAFTTNNETLYHYLDEEGNIKFAVNNDNKFQPSKQQADSHNELKKLFGEEEWRQKAIDALEKEGYKLKDFNVKDYESNGFFPKEYWEGFESYDPNTNQKSKPEESENTNTSQPEPESSDTSQESSSQAEEDNKVLNFEDYKNNKNNESETSDTIEGTFTEVNDDEDESISNEEEQQQTQTNANDEETKDENNKNKKETREEKRERRKKEKEERREASEERRKASEEEEAKIREELEKKYNPILEERDERYKKAMDDAKDEYEKIVKKNKQNNMNKTSKYFSEDRKKERRARQK